jgi:DNA-binding response OmpR family regulator
MADNIGMATPPSPLVLIVDNDEHVRRPLTRFLQMKQFQVVTAETVEEAIEVIGSRQPQAAIVELRLATGSGRDVVVSMPPGTPVIIFSGAPSESTQLERLRPRTRVIQKPYSLLLVVESLRDMLAKAAQPDA